MCRSTSQCSTFKSEEIRMEIIARIYNDFDEKFGIPRQSGLAEHVISRIVFEPEYRNPHALRGLEEYSHIWLIWQFSEHVDSDWSPTVRPPRLGGNKRVGVFATRSPFRPNPIGLSSVKIEKIDLETAEGPVIFVSGADMMNETPIYDIKPYLPYVDCHPDARGSFAEERKDYRLDVILADGIEEQLKDIFSEEQMNGLIEVLSMDPRPSYQDDPERVYGIYYGRCDVKFQVREDKLIVKEVHKA